MCGSLLALALALSSLLPLLLLLVLASEITAVPLPREISRRRTAFGAVYQANDGSVRAFGPPQWHHPVSNAPVRHSSMEENFNPSIQPYASTEFPRFSHGTGGHPHSQHNHEKIVNNNGGEPQGTVRREVTPLRESSDSLQGQRNTILRSTAHPVSQNGGILRPTTENHRTDSHSSYPETADRRSAGDIVFPDNTMNVIHNVSIKNCSEDGIKLCFSNVRDYPYHRIAEVIANSAYDFSSYFQDDHIEVATRIEADDNEDPVCESEERVVYPKVGQNPDGQALFIVNNDANYKQGIKVEICRRVGSPCVGSNGLPNGHKAKCKQKYSYRKLLSLKPYDNVVAPEDIMTPSCCACYITKDLQPSFRSLLPSEDQQKTPASLRQ